MLCEREPERGAAWEAQVGAELVAPVGLRHEVGVAAGDDGIRRRRSGDEVAEIQLADVSVDPEAQLIVAGERARDLQRRLPEGEIDGLVAVAAEGQRRGFPVQPWSRPTT